MGEFFAGLWLAISGFFGVAFPWMILIIMLLGLFGLVIPVFPGGTIIWAAALVYGLVEGFQGGEWYFGIITVLMLASVSADNLFMGGKAKEAGASWLGIITALVSAFVISIFFTPIAGLVAAPAALFITEYIRLKDTDEAMKITRGLMMGCGWAFVVRFLLGAIKIVLFCFWAF